MRKNYQPPFDRLKNIISESLKGWELSLLISSCLAVVILGVFFVTKGDSEEVMEVKECSTDDIAHAINLISPVELGVSEWKTGDYAAYQYRPKLSTPELVFKRYFTDDAMKTQFMTRAVKFQIVGELEESRYWMRTTGFAFYRDIPEAIYRLVRLSDMRITHETPRYNFVENYIPVRLNDCLQTSTPLATLVKLGEITLDTSAGQIECTQYRVEFGPDSTPIEIWTNPKVSPLGIVRISTPKEILELTAYGQERELQVPEVFQPVIEGTSTLEKGCSSCHGPDCHDLIFPPQ